MRVGRTTISCIRRFFGGERGSITVEFVVTLPILLAALGFAEQYGQAMQTRNALDVAARDAARFISRAPLDETGTTVPDGFLCAAREIITARLTGSISFFEGGDVGLTRLGCTGFYADAGGEVATDGSGAPVTDSIQIIATPESTQIVIVAYAEFGFMKWFDFRTQDAEFTNDGANASYRYTELQKRTKIEGLWMTAEEVWPRTQ